MTDLQKKQKIISNPQDNVWGQFPCQFYLHIQSSFFLDCLTFLGCLHLQGCLQFLQIFCLHSLLCPQPLNDIYKLVLMKAINHSQNSIQFLCKASYCITKIDNSKAYSSGTTCTISEHHTRILKLLQMIKTLGYRRVPYANSKLLNLTELLYCYISMHTFTYNHVMQILGLS